MIEKIEKAISIIEDSKSSHYSWISFYEKYPDEESKFSATVGGIEWHKSCIEGYNYVTNLLEKLKKIV